MLFKNFIRLCWEVHLMPKKITRTRNYCCVVYPDSAADNWIDILRDQCVSGYISPLHDMDTDPDGVIKKPHYHVLIMYDGVKTFDQFQEFCKLFGGVCHISESVVQSSRGYARYLCHLDNPEKHRYNIDDVIELGGTDYKTTIARNSDKYENIRQMIYYIEKYRIRSYRDLFQYAMDNNLNWFTSLCDNSTGIIKAYLSDFRQYQNEC